MIAETAEFPQPEVDLSQCAILDSFSWGYTDSILDLSAVSTKDCTRDEVRRWQLRAIREYESRKRDGREERRN